MEVSDELIEKSENSVEENANKAKKRSKKEIKVETSAVDSLMAVETDAVIVVANGEKKGKKSKKELNGCNSEIEVAEEKPAEENIPQIKVDVDTAVEKKQSRIKKEISTTEDTQDTGEPPLKKKRKKDTAEVSEVKKEDKSSEPGDFSNFRISPALIQKLKGLYFDHFTNVRCDVKIHFHYIDFF